MSIQIRTFMACLTFFFCPLAIAATVNIPGGGQVIVNAKNAFRDYDKGTLELSGDVQIIYGQQYIGASRAVIKEKTEEIEADGNLVISSPQAYIEGDRAVLNYRTNTGIIYNGFVKSGQVIFQGKVVRKTGPDTYEADNATYTACTTCPTAWTFGGTKIQAEIGGYAYIKNSILEVANVPVLWLPYLIVPLKSERQTGLLIPSLEFPGNDEVALSGRFFWALSRSQDATFTLTNYSIRGPKGHVNYRYMLSPQSEGELNTAYLNDKIFAADQSKLGNPVGNRSNRWFLTYQHQYFLPEGFTQKTKINFLSDLRYPRDFPEEIAGRGDPALENRLSLTKNTEETHASFDTLYFINQLKTNPVASNKDTVQRWPELRFSQTERPLFGTSLLFNFSANYVNFAREDFAYDEGETTSGEIDANRTSGSFNPELDLIRTGQRLDMMPEVSYPLRIGPYLDILPSVQLRHTQYSFNVSAPEGSSFDPAPHRQYVRGRISTRTRFYRVYGGGDPNLQDVKPKEATSWTDAESRTGGTTTSPDLTAPTSPPTYRHEIIPEVMLSGVPYIRQTGAFGNAQVGAFLEDQPISNTDIQSFRQGILFDYEDRLAFRNTMSLNLGNKWVRKRFENGEPIYKQIASLHLSQSYDLDEARRQEEGPRFVWSHATALLDMRLDNFETNTKTTYFPYHKVANTSSRVRMKSERGSFVEVRFTQTFRITRVIEEASNRTESLGFGSGFDSRYLTFLGYIDYIPRQAWPADLVVNRWGAELKIKPPGDCWGIRAKVEQGVGDRPQFKFDLDYMFGGV